MPKKKSTKKLKKTKFIWRKHIQDTLHEYRKFFIVLLIIMGLAFAIGVVRAIFVRIPCEDLFKAAQMKKEKTVDINYKLK